MFQNHNISNKSYLITLFTIILLLAISIFPSVVTPQRADVHSTVMHTNNCPHYLDLDYERFMVAYYLETLGYLSNEKEDKSISYQVDYSLPNSDTWYFSGHGARTTWGPYNWQINYLEMGPSEGYNEYYCDECGVSHARFFGTDVPSLEDQTEFEQMRFAFVNACYSSWSHLYSTTLHEGFINNGAEAYLGWPSWVDTDVASDFAIEFYLEAAYNELTIEDARNEALKDVSPNQDPEIYGNENIDLVP